MRELAPEEDRIRLLAITNIGVMDDGQVGAFVVSVEPTRPPEGTEIMPSRREIAGWPTRTRRSSRERSNTSSVAPTEIR
ncbi:MAG: hypothetical protein M3Q71_18050 [Chloroflexota bacterium]|nr:hypothetical protein [Chloroflexota bacterium]